MNRTEKVYKLHRILSVARRPVPRKRLEEELGCTRSTVVRLLDDLRYFLGAPIEYDRENNGYFYNKSENPSYELPGFWFNASELYALLACQKLLTDVQSGFLETHLEPLKKRIEKILVTRNLDPEEITRRIRILSMGGRGSSAASFQTAAHAVLSRKRIKISYHGRERDIHTEREISPQRLVHYRDNWYLDAWCHLRKGLRSFSIDRITEAKLLKRKSKDILSEKLDAHFSRSYGIFAGKPKETARLRFTGEAVRWAADENWHPEQKGRFVEGAYELEVPYSDPRELVRDILKYGPDVRILSPDSLKNMIKERLEQALRGYEK